MTVTFHPPNSAADLRQRYRLFGVVGMACFAIGVPITITAYLSPWAIAADIFVPISSFLFAGCIGAAFIAKHLRRKAHIQSIIERITQ